MQGLKTDILTFEGWLTKELEGKTLPTITAIMVKGCYQVSTGYNY